MSTRFFLSSISFLKILLLTTSTYAFSYPIEIAIGTRLSGIFDPALTRGSINRVELMLIHRTLVKRDRLTTLRGDLANSWRMNPTHDVYSFCIGEEHFHDGRKITLEDIRYSIARVSSKSSADEFFSKDIWELSPKITPNYAWKKVAPPGYCFDIRLSKPSMDFLFLIAAARFSIVPNGSKPTDTVGAGAFKVDQFIEHQKLVLTRVGSSKPHHPDIIVFKEVLSDQDAIGKLERKEIDLYAGFSDMQLFEKLKRPNFEIRYVNGLTVSHLIFNCARADLKNEELRQDIYRLFRLVITDHLAGLRPLEPQYSLIPKGMMPYDYYVRSDTQIENDFRKMFVQKWKNKTQKKKFLVLGAIGELNSKMVADFEEVFGSIGVKFEYFTTSYRPFYKLLYGYKYDAAFGSWMPSVDKPESFISMVSSMVKDTSLANEDVDKLMKQLDSQSVDSSDILQVRKKSQSLLEFEKKAIVAPLFRVWFPIAVSKRISFPLRPFQNYINFDEIEISTN